MNVGTLVVFIIVAGAIGGAIFAMIKKKKKGHGSCGCGCSSCSAAEKCGGKNAG